MTPTKSLSANATLPPLPTVKPESTVLSSSFVLPKDAQIVYSQLHCPDAIAAPDTYELARQSILVANGSKSLLESMLPIVYLKEDSSLWVFAITDKSELEERRSQLDTITSHFSPRDIYPCSVPCSTRPTRCPSCPASLDANAASCSSIVCQLPREPLRHPFSLFLQAVRLRLLDDIVQTAYSISPSKPSTAIKSVKRFKDGFLFHPGSESSNEWTHAWNFNASSRPMLYCHLKIHLSSTRIVVHPILRPTQFTTLASSPPPTSGTPLILLPYGTSAYFISTYAGSTSALNAQFSASLKGMGAGDDWASSYVVCYIKVENKNGEEKGLTSIWPTKLCLGYRSGGGNDRLIRLPTLPPQLQPSPALAARQAKTATAPVNSPIPTSVVTPAPTPIAIVEPSHIIPGSPAPFDRPALASSPTTAALSIFRSLSLGKESSVQDVAFEAGHYVEAVVKGRARERERIRKDRESLSDHAQSLDLALPQADEVIGMPVQMTHDSPVVAIFQQSLPPPAPPPLSPTQPQAQLVAQVTQDYYPSPNSTGTGGPGTVSAQGTTPDVTVQVIPPEPISNTASVASAPSFTDWNNSLSGFNATDTSLDFGYGMGMNMDLDLDFGQSSQSTSAPQVTTAPRTLSSYGGMSMSFDGLFTEDDFSFFDAPSKVPVSSAPASVQPEPSVLGFEPHNAYVSPPPTNLPFSPATFEAWGTGFDGAPASVVGVATPAESPLKMASVAPYHSPPATPGLVVDDIAVSSPSHQIESASRFQPIRFANKHRFTDDKYLGGGKFSLPKSTPSSPTKRNAKFTYEGKTNPRLAIVKKLIGAKRKSNSAPEGERARKSAFGLPSPSWERDLEDWMLPTATDEREEKQLADSEDEDEDMDDSMIFIDEHSPFASRPTTPQPDYLPLGPTLLHTQFIHSHLLSLSTPLQRSSASSPGPGLPIVSVPTPVSPAAALNANSEKNRVYEAVALALAKEVVENGVWADAWVSSEANRSKPKTAECEVESNDLTTLERVLECIPGTSGQLNMETLFHLDERDGGASLFSFESPKVLVSKGEAIVQILPTAFRFWDKLGLGPQNGQKKLTAYVLTERHDEVAQNAAASWLEKMASMFRDKKMGTIAAGHSNRCSKPGVISLHFEHFRKELELVLSAIPPDCINPILLAVIPTHLMSLTSPIFRQIMATVSRAHRSGVRPFVFRCVPEEMMLGSRSSERFLTNATDLCLSLYDQVLKPMVPSMLRRNLPLPVPEQLFQAQAFTLARNDKPKVTYLRQPNVPTTSAIDRHTLLHVGYQISRCRRWLMASCVDQRGEGHDLGVWLMHPEDTTRQQIVNCVWNFADTFAKKASVEWRIAISRMGPMSPAELEAWISHLAQVVATGPTKQVSVLSVERDTPWLITGTTMVPPPAPRQLSATGNSFFIDISHNTVAIETPRRFPLSCGIPSFHDLTRIPPCVLDTNEEPEQPDSDILPLYSTALIHLSKQNRPMLQLHLLHTIKSPNSTLTTQDKETLSDITFSFHNLSVLAKWKRRTKESEVSGGSLPWHLGALDIMETVLVDFFSQL